jgi:hypothetical protein
MIPLPSFKGLLGKGPSGFDPDYQAILNRGTALGYTLPDVVTQAAGNQLVVQMKAQGIWSKLDVLYLFGTTGDQNFALLNWKNPNLFQCTLFNAPPFRSKYGFSGDGVSAYIGTTFVPISNGVQYTLNNASRSAYISTSSGELSPTTAFGAIDGVVTGTGTARFSNASSGFHRINAGANLATSQDLLGGGLRTISRIDSATVVVTAGSVANTSASASTTNSGLAQLVFRSSAVYGDCEVGMYAMGSELTGVYSSFSTLINNYMRAMETSFDADYQAVINKAVSLGYNLPSAYCQYMQNDMVVKLKSAGIWSKLDLFYMFESDSSDLNFATLNWKDPNSFQITAVNAPTWLQGRGISTNGTTQFLNTNWTPSLHAVNYTLNDACVFYKADSQVAGSHNIGQTLGSTGGLSLRSDNSTSCFVNSTTILSASPSSSSGDFMRMFSRTSSTDVTYRGIQKTLNQSNNLRTQTTNFLPANPIWIGRSGGLYGGITYRSAGFGASLTLNETRLLDSIITGTYGAF